MLSTTLEGVDNIVQSLNTPEQLQYARVYAQLVSNVFYLELKRDFWEYYYKVAIETEVWSLKLSKQMIKDNHLQRIQFATQEKVERRRHVVMEELKQAEKLLNEHKQLVFIHQSIDMKRLSTVIPAFVSKGQHQLYKDFERKKLVLQLDANEYHSVLKFYDLKPSENQV
jgi:hypothetical protein